MIRTRESKRLSADGDQGTASLCSRHPLTKAVSKTLRFACFVLACVAFSLAQDKKIPIAEAVENAVKQSKLTLPGSSPFHLKAEIRDLTGSRPEYNAAIEEYWMSPEKWRRTIESAGFSQTLIVDRANISEQSKGDYYPFWLHDLVTALVDPLPMSDGLKQLKAVIDLPTDSLKSNACLNFGVPAGVAPVRINLTYVFCFQGKLGLLQRAITPGYKANFEDYKAFKGKRIAHRITMEAEPGLHLEDRITQLDNPGPLDEKLFAADNPTPAGSRLQSLQVGEPTARALALSTPEIQWPPVREGKNSGTVSLYISTDRSGQVREAWVLASDNPEVNTAARDQVLRWRFKPYVNVATMQMESVLVFAFNTTMGAPVMLLSNGEARKLAAHVVEPRFPKGAAPLGKKFKVRVSVDEQGKLTGVRPLETMKPPALAACEQALRQWKFDPYLRDGHPDRFNADITFTVR